MSPSRLTPGGHGWQVGQRNRAAPRGRCRPLEKANRDGFADCSTRDHASPAPSINSARGRQNAAPNSNLRQTVTRHTPPTHTLVPHAPDTRTLPNAPAAEARGVTSATGQYTYTKHANRLLTKLVKHLRPEPTEPLTRREIEERRGPNNGKSQPVFPVTSASCSASATRVTRAAGCR